MEGIEWVANGIPDGPAAGLNGKLLRSWVVEEIPGRGQAVRFSLRENEEAFKAARIPKNIGCVPVLIATRPDLAALAAAHVARETAVRAERARVAAEQDAAAKAACPSDCVPCRRNWSNGDLCSAEYQAEDGTKLLASDLLETHGGWYYLPVDEVESAREKTRAQAAAVAAKKAARDAHEAGCLARARETGVDVVIETWTEDCAGPRSVECSTDVVARIAQPDGSVRVKRSHTH